MAINCTKCAQGYFLLNNRCLSVCTNGYYKDYGLS